MRCHPSSCVCLFASRALVGCPSEPPPDPSPDPLPEAEVRWYLGPSELTFAGGSPVLESEYLLRRSVDPEAGSIREQVVTGSSAAGWMSYEIVYTVTVEDAESDYTLEYTDDYGDWEGEGTLTGAPWSWDAWEGRSEYVTGPYAGSYVLTEVTRTPTEFLAESQVWSPDDHFEADIVESLERVDEQDWEDRLAELDL